MYNYFNKTTLIYRYIVYNFFPIKHYFIITLSLLLIINSVSQTYSAPYVDNLSKDYTFNIGQEVDLIYDFDFGIDPDFHQMGNTYNRTQLHIWHRTETAKIPGLSVYQLGYGFPPHVYNIRDNPVREAFHGTPVKSGKYKIAYKGIKNDAYGDNLSTLTMTFNITVLGVEINSPELPDAKINLLYPEQILSASGGTGPYTFQVKGLPDGLTHKDGHISGTPTKTGKFNITAIATDAKGYTGEHIYQIEVTPIPTIIINPDALPAGKVNVPYPAQTLSATGGTEPYTYQAKGLPNGLTLNSNKITGTPTEAKSAEVTITATDKDNYKHEKTYKLEIAPEININPDALPAGKVNVPYPAQTLSATGGTEPYTYQAKGLPNGLTLNGNKIAGIPTEAKNAEVIITATDKDNYKLEKTYKLEIAPEININPDALPAGKVNAPYPAQTLSATGGTEPYAYQAKGLPNGLTLNGNKITGTPTEAKNAEVTITATDKNNYKLEKTYILKITDLIPQGQSLTLNVVAGASASVELTQGASGGPFSGAKIVTSSKVEAGQAEIQQQEGKYLLVFHASPKFSGSTRLTYSLSNKSATSAPALVTINVAARPDPSKDEEVIGLVRAQVEAANQLATTQISNFNQRLEQLHNDEGDCRENSIGLGIKVQGQSLNPNLSMLNDAHAKSCSDIHRKFSFWTNGQIGVGKNNDRGDKDRDNANQKHTSIGISGGVDYRFSPSFIGGVGVGYGQIVTDIGQHGTKNKGTMLSTELYGSYHPGKNIFLDGVLGYGWLQFDSKRYVTPTGGSASGERKGNQIFGSLTLGYEHRKENWLLSPYTRIDAAHTKLYSFSEKGGGNYNLTFGDQTINLLSATLGLRGEYTVPMEWGQLKPHARLEYSHNFSGSSKAKVDYTNIGGSLANTIDIGSKARDSFKIELGVDAQLKNGWLVGADYSTRIDTNSSLRHNYRLKLSKTF